MKKVDKINIIAIILIACMVISGCTILTLEVFSQTFGRTEGFRDDYFYTYITWSDIDQSKYSRQTVYFYSGENRLQGFIYGSTNNKGLVVISHGLGGTADAYLPQIMYFVDQGWRVFSYNNTGVAGSQGDSIRGLSQSVIDLNEALKYISNTNEFSGLPIMLVGHSWGGFAVCAVLNFDHNVSAVVSYAGFNSTKEIFQEQGVALVGGVYYILTPQLWSLERQLFGDAVNLTAVDGINRAGIPVMVIQSSDDEIVLADSSSIYAHPRMITDPNLELVYFEGEQASGHEFVFGSREQKEYMDAANESWEAYREGHKNVTNALLSGWAREYNFDKIRANELNADLMDKINRFFEDSTR